jgi:hypothetical protein
MNEHKHPEPDVQLRIVKNLKTFITKSAGARSSNCEFAHGPGRPWRLYTQWCRLFQANCDTRTAICQNRASIKDHELQQILDRLKTIDEKQQPPRPQQDSTQRNLPGVPFPIEPIPRPRHE